MYPMYSLSRVLVTGGAGFIGSHLVEKLIELGAYVTVLDNLSTGRLQNLEKVLNRINFIEGDIQDLATCMQATKDIDFIFHLAAFVSVPDSVNNPEACYQDNIVGTLNILQSAQSHGVKRIVFSSSSAVYGTFEGKCSENTPCNPTSPYGHSKFIGELLCKRFTQTSNLSTVILRYFNVFGERQNPNGPYAAVVAQFKECMKNNQPIPIFGDGLQTRDFVSVWSVVNANVATGSLPIGNSSFEIFNVGSGKSITLLELVEQLKKEFPSFNAGITFLPGRKGDIKTSYADCSKLSSSQKHSGH